MSADTSPAILVLSEQGARAARRLAKTLPGAKIHTRKGKDEIVGATIVASHAGDLIGEVCVAMAAGFGLGSIAGVIHPYPTQAEAIKKTGDAYHRARLTPFVARLMKRWLAWRR